MPTLSEVIRAKKAARLEAQRGLEDPARMDPERIKKWLRMRGGNRRRGGEAPPPPPLEFTDTFDANVDGWSAGPNTALSWDAGTLRIANQIAANSYAFIEIPITPGVPYIASVLNAGAGNSNWKVGTTENGSEHGEILVASSATGNVPFTPVGSTVFLTYRNDFNGQFSARNADNVSVVPA